VTDTFLSSAWCCVNIGPRTVGITFPRPSACRPTSCLHYFNSGSRTSFQLLTPPCAALSSTPRILSTSIWQRTSLLFGWTPSAAPSCAPFGCRHRQGLHRDSPAVSRPVNPVPSPPQLSPTSQ
jgi:hypothetical protein